jgi:leader peptidase (prepilin peptidase)/N-methyltransferase
MVGSAFLTALALAALSAVSRNGLGRGDVRLASVLVLHLASIGALVALRGVLLAFVVGGVVAAVMMLSRRATRTSTFAFGPYLVVAAFVVVLVPALGR